MLDFLKFWRPDPNRTPQADIDAEARRLIVEYDSDAVSHAEGWVQRSQWSKGNNDKIDRSRRVLKAVRQRARFLK